jgi:ubiquitin C-terminal hydrolase
MGEKSSIRIKIPDEYDFGLRLGLATKKYRLIAIVVHYGPDVTHGHYICYALRWVKKQRHWFKLDDSSSEQVGLGDI